VAVIADTKKGEAGTLALRSAPAIGSVPGIARETKRAAPERKTGTKLNPSSKQAQSKNGRVRMTAYRLRAIIWIHSWLNCGQNRMYEQRNFFWRTPSKIFP
jgi:hypothetical protein